MQIKDLQMKRALRNVLFILLLCLAGRTKMQAQTVQHINYGITSTDPPEVWVMGVDVSYYGNMLSITVPSSVIINMKTYTVVGINAAAFSPMTQVKTASIPSTVRNVGGFVNCAKLQTININSNVDFSIGGFSGCSKLTSVNISHLNHLVSITGSAFSGCTDLTSSSISLSNAINLSKIYGYAFSGCSKLSSISIPVNVTMIYKGAFNNCSLLHDFNYNARNCTTVIAPSTPSTFNPNEHWLKNTPIHNLSIGAQVQSIPDYAFYDCNTITSIMVNAVNPPTLGSNVFYNVNKNIPVTVPCGSVNAYRNATGWSEFTNIQESSYEISVEVNPSEGGTITGTGIYCPETSCTLTATANSGYTFTNWTENGTVVSTDSSYSFIVTGNRNLVANFTVIPQNYTISASTNPSNGGTVTGAGTYMEGATCTVTATPNNGYSFTNWTENDTVVSIDASYSFTVTSNRTLVANFSLNSYNISVVANPTTGGTITGGGSYTHGTTCNLMATANSGYTFINWTESGTVVSTDASYSFTVTDNRNLVANFSLNSYTISALANPTAGGTITGGGTYDYGASCTLTATANSGYAFTNWTENDSVVSADAVYSFTVTGDRNLVANFELCSYSITALVNPEMSGTVTGSGSYLYGNNCTLTATANEGYTFINWTKGSDMVSTDATYSFTVTESGEYVANFELISYQITTTVNPTEGGMVTGGGTYVHGSTCTLTAVANEDYAFSNWTENGIVVSTDTVYSFTVSSHKDLVANFTHVGTGGLLNGLFSVGNNTKVYFSQGNLQYQASTDTWRFATNQYDHIGEDNANISQTYDGWIDLFGWGTSGYDHGAVCYQPWSTSQTNSDYYAYGDSQNSLYDQTGKADWGYNTISNGGNQENLWHTLNYWEWKYVFQDRTTTSGIRYAKAVVDEVKGIILLPDDWEAAYYTLNNTNDNQASFNSNTITASAWGTLEQHGAVFLPAAGFRDGVSVHFMNDRAWYWSSYHGNENWSWAVSFGDDFLGLWSDARCSGHAVRLVKTVTYTINTTSSPIGGGTVIGAGTYDSGETCTLTAIANEGHAFVNWTENGNTVSTNSTISFVVSCDRNIVANFLYIGTEEMMKGMFSVSNNKKVCFSQGNLQYQASTNTWRFADHQWDWVGGTVQGVHYGNVGSSSNSNISSTYDGWIDLFGWGTSGWDNGNTYYHPWDIKPDNDGTLFGPPGKHNLVGEYANADWGVYNPISNGGNQANQWRTLTYWEWDYLFNTRATSSGVRYAKAQVNDVKGLILVPDNWESSIYGLQNVNTSESSFDSNVIDLTVWINTFESNGAVFLPAAGARFYGTTMFYLNDRGYYWSSTCHGNFDDYASNWAFSDEWLNYFAGNRSTGLSVRLVRDVVAQTVNLSQGWNWFSTNIEITLEDLQNALVDAAPNTNITIKSNTQNIAYNPGTNQWRGTLDSLDVSQMYMIQVGADCQITLTGTSINPNACPITIHNGNNWIAFPLSESMSISDAFSGFATNGDIIKSRTTTARYNNGSWRGGLDSLKPGQGYIYKSNVTETRTFTFPTSAK